MTTKPSKVLIIGSGPIIIGQASCHSERSEESVLHGTRTDSSVAPIQSGLLQNDSEYYGLLVHVLKDCVNRMKEYFVYIMTNYAKTPYTGMTNNLEHRVFQHKMKLVPGFSARYDLNILAYYESTTDVKAAIAREKQIKGWLRKKKIALIEAVNPEWRDLSLEWETHEVGDPSLRSG